MSNPPPRLQGEDNSCVVAEESRKLVIAGQNLVSRAMYPGCPQLLGAKRSTPQRPRCQNRTTWKLWDLNDIFGRLVAAA